MKAKTLSALAGLGGAMFLSGSAQAIYTGLTVELFTTNAGHSVFRVYANFTNANDYVTAVAGSDTIGPVVIKSINANDTGPGSNFFNPGGAGAGNLAPSSPSSPNYYGTYATIGISDSTQGTGTPSSPNDETWLSPGFPNFINGNQLSNNNMGWFTAGPVAQGRAGYVPDGDLQLRVQIMQLSVDVGSNVKGTVSVSGTYQNDSGGNTVFTANGETFAPPIPAPAAIALLALAGVCGSRSRRRDT